MAVVRPFRALRPNGRLAERIAALPYDVMNSVEAKDMVEGNSSPSCASIGRNQLPRNPGSP